MQRLPPLLLVLRRDKVFPTMDMSSSSSSSSNSDDERRQRVNKCAALAVVSAAEASAERFVKIQGGSFPGRARNGERRIGQGAAQIDMDYSNRLCLLPAPIAEAEFERRFRMPPSVYELLREGILGEDIYFRSERMPRASSERQQIRKWFLYCGS
jgi:hypothetical protein